jgi:hypothetical protein
MTGRPHRDGDHGGFESLRCVQIPMGKLKQKENGADRMTYRKLVR